MSLVDSIVAPVSQCCPCNGRLPSISVVIPCHNTSGSLQLVLLALKTQISLNDEIICVDDNSTIRESAQIKALSRAFKASYIDLPRMAQHRGRRSVARNVGTYAARGAVILYLDSDMIVGPEYLMTVRRLHTLNRAALIKGTRIDASISDLNTVTNNVTEDIGPRLPLGGEYLRYQHIATHPAVTSNQMSTDAVAFELDGSRWILDRWDWCASNNLSVRRKYVCAARGWDQRFVGWGEEDMDFAYRMFRLGLRPMTQVSGPLFGVHITHRVDRDANRRSLQDNARYFVGKFPEVAALRQHAYAGYGVYVPCREDRHGKV